MSSKYFCLPLTEDEKHRVATAVGLYQWQFVLAEIFQGEILRCSQVSNGKVDLLMENPENRTLLTVNHPKYSKDQAEKFSLWNAIVPHPFFLLPQAQCANAQDPFFLGMQQLWKSLLKLEDLFFQSELSVVEFGKAGVFPVNLLFHYVRGRCVRVGLTDWPREFGARIQRFEIPTEGYTSPGELSQAIEITVEKAGTALPDFPVTSIWEAEPLLS